MRISATTSISAVAVAAVAVLGAQYADAASNHVTPAAHVSSSAPNRPGSGAAQLAAAPLRNLAYLYTTSSSGGNDQVFITVPNPPAGVYAASFAANMFPAGTPSAPETFSCYLLKNGDLRAQSTAQSVSTGGFYIGLSGSNTVKVASSDTFQAGCGTVDGTDWTYGSRPLQVTFTRLDGLVAQTLPMAQQQQQKAATSGQVATR